jgi:O-antigen/teichoic acid export membrane protein
MWPESRRKLLKSTLANYLGAAVLVVLPIVTLPTYISRLGDLQWGLVGFMGTLQSLLAIADTGFSQVLLREFSVRLSESPTGVQRAAALLRGSERFYFVLLSAVLVITVLLSRVVADHWLNLPAGSRGLGAKAVVGGGLLCLLYVPGSLYRSVAMAGEEQVRFNLILAAGTILRFGGGAIVVSRWPQFEVYLAWFIATFGIEVAARSILAWRVVGGRALPGRSRGELRQLISGMGAWSIAVGIGAISMQMDKVILSRAVPIAELASYYVASQLAMGMLQIFSPMIAAMMPRLLRPAKSQQQRSRDQWRLFLVMSVLGVAVLGAVWLVGRQLIGSWLGDQRAAEVAPILTVLLVGVCCNALCNVGYVNWLAHDRRSKVLGVNTAALFVVGALTILTVPRIGLEGAAVAWSAAQLLVLIVSLDWIPDAVKNC